MTGADTQPAAQEAAGAAPDPATPAQDPEAPHPSAEAPQEAAAAPARVHVLEAAANQRERVLTSFAEQRSAINKAVDDQRAAAMAPIDAVRARLGRGPLRGNPQPALGAKATSGSGVAAEIVSILKGMIAEEVRVQLMALLAADQRGEPRNAAAPAAAAADPDISQRS